MEASSDGLPRTIQNDDFRNNNQQKEFNMSAIYHSQMKPSLTITRDSWAVSMVIENKPFSMHTLLLIETIQESGVKNFKAHLMGPGTLVDKRVDRIERGDPRTCCSCWSTVGKVDITPLHEVIELKRFRSNYETWSVRREQAQAMIDQIHEEKEHPELVDRPFHLFGEKSFFARKRIELDIQDERLLQMREQEPEKFQALYTLYEEWKEREKQFHAECKITGSPLLESHEVFPKKYPVLKVGLALLSPGVRLIFNKDKQVHKIIGGAAYMVGMLPAFWTLGIIGGIVDFPRLMYNLNESKKKEELMNLFDKHVQKIKIVSQNCFNWARSKLTSIDIDVGERSCERFAVIPTSYLPDQTKAPQERVKP